MNVYHESGNIPSARGSHGTISGLVATRLIASALALGRTPIPHVGKTGYMSQLMVAHASNVGGISNEGIGVEREEALKRTP